jgi:hypothetical protein
MDDATPIHRLLSSTNSICMFLNTVYTAEHGSKTGPSSDRQWPFCSLTTHIYNQDYRMPSVIESNETSIPPEQKYFTEAAKRLRKDGTNQFEELHFSTDERLRSLAEDPWADHAALDRLPLPVRDGGSIKFLITGTGFGGIIMAIKLVKAGFTADQIVLVEAGGGVGGTWYWNRYPGLHCKFRR